jgi:hypothetical protein
MTLEGGGGGIVGDIVGGVGDIVGGAVDIVSDVVGGAVDVVKDVGRDIDDFVNEEIPGGWVTVGVAAGGAALASGSTAGAAGATEIGAASTAAPGSFSAALPELGVVTKGGATALPGTFAAETAGLLGTGTALAAPISVATGVPANEAAYPAVSVEPTFTPAPGSFQEALPGLGVQTQASTAPFTAAPGSFAAATAPAATLAGYGVLSPTVSPSASLQDAFRVARLGQGLMAEQPQQQMPTQQLPGMQAGAVDLLSLPQLRASRADIASLLSPSVYRGPIFDIYSGLPTSLLG